MKVLNSFGAMAVVIGLSVASPTFAQTDFQTDVATWIDSARESAQSANARYDGLVEQIRSATDAEAAKAGLLELVEEAKRAADSYGEDSPLWDDYKDLSDFTEERKQYSLNKLQETGDARWQKQNDRWKANGDRLQDVRVKILQEAVRAKSLAASAEQDLDYILDVMLADGVEAAIAELEAVYTDLKSVNDNLDKALEAARSELVGGSGG